ncbi:MAG: hypothetical protein Q8R72_07965 [Hylemonella sp.]|nr:hypothetical protein [Hylemonella sp.]
MNVIPEAPPTVLDVEASGFGRLSYPIEVGYVLPDGHVFCTLIRPEPQWTHWDPQAAQLHRIPRPALLSRGRPVAEVAELLNRQLQGRTVYSDGWNHDYTWLALLFEAAGQQPRFKLDNLRALLREEEAERWHAVKQQIADERGAQRHRASTDAQLLQLTLQRVRHGAAVPS